MPQSIKSAPSTGTTRPSPLLSPGGSLPAKPSSTTSIADGQKRDSFCRKEYEKGQASAKFEVPDFDFDFTASPRAEQWRSSETADGRAVYSTTQGDITVEFQNWDW